MTKRSRIRQPPSVTSVDTAPVLRAAAGRKAKVPTATSRPTKDPDSDSDVGEVVEHVSSVTAPTKPKKKRRRAVDTAESEADAVEKSKDATSSIVSADNGNEDSTADTEPWRTKSRAKKSRKKSKKPSAGAPADHGAASTMNEDNVKSGKPKPKDHEQHVLPVVRYRQQILDAYHRSDVLVLQSATGSGKTTQVPQFLAQCVEKKILCTQPRRVAATSVAARVASEMQTELGENGKVGYRVRFQDCSAPENKVLFLTDGMAVREAVHDRDFSQYSCILLDEAHERSVQTDVLMGLVKEAMRRRKDGAERVAAHQLAAAAEVGECEVANEGSGQKSPDLQLLQKIKKLKVIVMSATLETGTFTRFFGDEFETNVLKIDGRQHPVKIYYTPTPVDDYLLACATAILQLHRNKPSGGDILCFLPGQESIESLCHLLEERRRSDGDGGCGADETIDARLRKEAEKRDKKRGAAKDSSNDLKEGAEANKAGTELKNAEVEDDNGKSREDEGAEDEGPPRTSSKQMLDDDLLICPLYAALPFDQQMSVFTPAPPNSRKVVLATNIAETSITIPGIRYVVDSGYVKLKIAHPTTGVECLKIVETSKAQAEQRTGRAGREAPGECYRIYPESCFKKFARQTPPEILRTEFSQLYLLLKSLHVDRVDRFPFLDVPPKQHMIKACFFLKRIQALDKRLELTDLGRKLARLPLHPLFGLVLLTSVEFQCTAEILTIVAMMSIDAVFFLNVNDDKRKKEMRDTLLHPLADQLSLLQIYRKWKKQPSFHAGKDFCHNYGLNWFALQRAEKVRIQLKELMQTSLSVPHICSCGSELDSVRKCFLKANFTNTAMLVSRTTGEYCTASERQHARVHPTSVLFQAKPMPEVVLFTELVTTTKTYMRTVMAVEPRWLMEVCGGNFMAVGGEDGQAGAGKK